jgi:protein involved in polysaccharide export with SLBB domain
VGQTRTIMVNVMGEVRTPGTYTLSAFATVFHALYMAGGTNDIGTLRNIKVFRGGKLVTVVDIYQYILSGRLAGNIRLQDNDVIQVGAYDCIVDIAGNVKRPMAYEMRKDESVKTLLDYAGGFTGNAYKKNVRLLRKSGKLKSVYNINEFDMSSFSIDDGDSITVDSILDRYENMVEVRGALFRPGMYRLGEEVNSVKTLIEAADGLLEEAFTAHAVLRRMKPNRTLEVVPVDVKGILEGTVADIPLQNEDILFVPTLQERMSERTVTLSGEVQFPGKYEFADNETVEDIILRAGGLTDQASVAKVDVSRRIRDPKATAKIREIAKTFSFSLKDGFVVDGEKGFLLEPYDVVHVRRSPAFSNPRNIRITGEVNYEGEFTLENKNMRLTDALKMAGGVTTDAYLRGARLTRIMTEEDSIRVAATADAIRKILTERGDSIDQADLQFSREYAIGIELDKALANPGSDYDMVLCEGDHIFVPEYDGTVKISGNVMFPNTVAYVEGKSYKKYVQQAGGFGNRAKKSKTFIVYQNGTMGVVSKGAKPEPGCEIIVPSKKHKAPMDLVALASTGHSLASLLALIIAITRL